MVQKEVSDIDVASGTRGLWAEGGGDLPVFVCQVQEM